MSKNTIVLAICSLFIFEQCKSKKDTESPVVSISNPQEGANYTKGQNLNLKINFTDNDELHHVVWSIQGKQNNVIVSQYDMHVDNSSWSIDTNIMITDSINTDYLLSTETEDHSENLTKKTVSFSIK
ncbi:MAG: Ig-like domain-containing protein [Bacteroidota bacterium]|nr:Ig-like domain-containing protein [Bacteroidota bacterium]